MKKFSNLYHANATMVRCPICGKNFPDDSKKCTDCIDKVINGLSCNTFEDSKSKIITNLRSYRRPKKNDELSRVKNSVKENIEETETMAEVFNIEDNLTEIFDIEDKLAEVFNIEDNLTEIFDIEDKPADVLNIEDNLTEIFDIENKLADVLNIEDFERKEDVENIEDAIDVEKIMTQKEKDNVKKIFKKDVTHHLIILSPDNYGKTYALDQESIFIGSNSENSLKLEQKGVSANHATIRIQNEKFYLNDLKSKKGTFLNGNKINREHLLKKGDAIKIGSTLFKFVPAGYAFIKEEEIQDDGEPLFNFKVNKKMVIGGLLTICFISLIFSIFNSNRGTPKAEAEVTHKQNIAKIEETKQDYSKAENQRPINKLNNNTNKLNADHYCKNGDTHFQNRRWKDALENYTKVSRLVPDYPGILEKINEAESELKSRINLEYGYQLIKDGNYEAARKKLNDIPIGSYYYKDAIAEIRKIYQKQHDKSSFSQVTKKKKNEETNQRVNKKKFQEAMTAFSQGEIQKALSLIEPLMSSHSRYYEKAERFKSKISEVENSFRKGMASYKAGDIDQAFEIWNRTLKLNKQIAGKKSNYYSRTIKKYRGEIYHEQASDAYAAGDYPLAYAKCKKTLKEISGHKGALNIRDLLLEKAEELYKKAYILEVYQPENARDIWNVIIKICAPHSKYYQKAQENILRYKNEWKQ